MLDLSMGMLISGTVIGAAGMLLLLRGKRESEPSSLLAGLALSVLPLVMHSVGMLWLAGAGVMGGWGLLRRMGDRGPVA
jgi:hypothetical protein